jgi:hypothetical protein
LRGVEDAHLDLFVRLRVGDELNPGEVQRRPLAGELILNDPLPKRLADGSGVARAKRDGDLLEVIQGRLPARSGRPSCMGT